VRNFEGSFSDYIEFEAQVPSTKCTVGTWVGATVGRGGGGACYPHPNPSPERPTGLSGRLPDAVLHSGLPCAVLAARARDHGGRG
jgi:hypothetical protein